MPERDFSTPLRSGRNDRGERTGAGKTGEGFLHSGQEAVGRNDAAAGRPQVRSVGRAFQSPVVPVLRPKKNPTTIPTIPELSEENLSRASE